MKKIKTGIVGVLGVIAVVCIGLTGLKYATANSASEWANLADQLNPFVKQAEIYVKTTDPVAVNGYGTASYEQEAVTADGTTRPIAFNGLSVLKVDHYLKLSAKGAHVITYEEVSEAEIPQQALEKLKKY